MRRRAPGMHLVPSPLHARRGIARDRDTRPTHLPDDHGFVGEVDQRLGHRQRQRPQPGAEATHQNDGLGGVIRDGSSSSSSSGSSGGGSSGGSAGGDGVCIAVRAVRRKKGDNVRRRHCVVAASAAGLRVSRGGGSRRRGRHSCSSANSRKLQRFTAAIAEPLPCSTRTSYHRHATVDRRQACMPIAVIRSAWMGGW
eukprot:349777-Chlamydomonas_euryale.AAC.4